MLCWDTRIAGQQLKAYRKIAIVALTYRCYITNDEPNLWGKWYRGATEEVQAKHDSVFEFLEARTDWQEPHYKNLQGKQKGLGEVRVGGKVQWRIFGFRKAVDTSREFVVTHVGSHKGNVYSPRDVLKTSHSRMKAVHEDASLATPCRRPKEA